jgi:hypothetical protein
MPKRNDMIGNISGTIKFIFILITLALGLNAAIVITRAGDVVALRQKIEKNEKMIAVLQDAISEIVNNIIPGSDAACQKAWNDGWRPKGYWRTRKRSRTRTKTTTK